MNPRFYKILLICSILTIYLQCKRAETDIQDIDGNNYSTALIGDFWWMKENLRTTRFNDGSSIPCVKDQSIWLKLDSAAYCYYKNNDVYADTLGFLYNWYAVTSEKLCPVGWRVPSDNEWKQLEGTADTKYGPNDSIWNKIGLRGFDAGQRLKSTRGWRKGITGTDDLDSSALPGGERLTRFYAGGSTGFWWTSTEASASGAYYRSLIYSFSEVSRDTHPKRMGFSVRCIRNKYQNANAIGSGH